MRATRCAVLGIALLLTLGTTGCAKKAAVPAPSAAEVTAAATQTVATDYSNSARWLALPASTTHEVDVFYLYPTQYTRAKATDPVVCAVNDPAMMKGAKGAMERTAAAFEPSADIYAPFYRQAD